MKKSLIVLLALLLIYTPFIYVSAEETDQSLGFSAQESLDQPSLGNSAKPGRITPYIWGVGTPTRPFLITTKEELIGLAGYINEGQSPFADPGYCFRLDADLDISGIDWLPIGTASHPFQGIFDGNGHQISGLTTTDIYAVEKGLFGALNGATVKNLGLPGVSVTGWQQVGGLASHTMNSTIDSCYVTGSLSGNDMIGGLIGTVDTGTTITNCYVHADIVGFAGSDKIGGLVGIMQGGSLTQSYATGSVTGELSGGGLVGNLISGNVTNCASLLSAVNGTIAGRIADTTVGTLSGNLAFTDMLVNSATTTGIASDQNGQDIAASAIQSDGSISGLFSNTANWVTAAGQLPTLVKCGPQNAALPDYIGRVNPYFSGSGTVGSPYLISTADQLWKMPELINSNAAYRSAHYKLTENIDISGMKDYLHPNGDTGWMPAGSFSFPFTGSFDGGGHTITGLSLDSTTSGEPDKGLFGSLQNAIVTNLGLLDVQINTNSMYAGGIAGRTYDSTISKCYVTGNISGYQYTGGIAGYVNTQGIFDCYTNVWVQAEEFVGGIAGYLDGTQIQSSYALGRVDGISSVGGLAGQLQASGNIYDSVALNPNINNWDATIQIGRVGGDINGAYVVNTLAFADMGINDVPRTSIDSKDGADAYAADLCTDYNGIFSTRFLSPTWVLEPNKLPILKGIDGQTNSMPGHIVFTTTEKIFSGSGTSAAPYLITTPEELGNLASLLYHGVPGYHNAVYRLENDLDLSSFKPDAITATYFPKIDDAGWLPIGSRIGALPFSGTFDGNGKVISGMTLIGGEYYGLFGKVNGEIYDLAVINATIQSGGAAGIMVSELELGGKISRCAVQGTITGSSGTGGFVGYTYGTIEDCYAIANVEGGDQVGGFAGYAPSGSISNVYAVGTVNGYIGTGGLVGECGADVQNSAALAQRVTGTSDVSRVIGKITGSPVISNNYAYDGMVSISGPTFTPTLANFGTAMTRGQMTYHGFWQNTLHWDPAVWIMQDDSLPLLNGMNPLNGEPPFDITEYPRGGQTFTLTPVTPIVTESLADQTVTINATGQETWTHKTILWTTSAGTIVSGGMAGSQGALTIPAGFFGTITITGYNQNGDLTATTTVTVNPLVAHPITVTTLGDGTASANLASAKMGTTVHLMANANDGSHFVRWEVVSGGITLTPDTGQNISFVMPDAAVEVRAVFAENPPNTYTVNVLEEGNGIAYASATSATPGTLINLYAQPDAGHLFSHWEVITGNIVFLSRGVHTASFLMPNEEVTVKAVFHPIPPGTYPIYVEVEGLGDAAASQESALAGTTITLSATPRPGYLFIRWETVTSGVTFANSTAPNTSFTMLAQEITVRAIFLKMPTNGGNSGSGSSSGGTDKLDQSVSLISVQQGSDSIKEPNLPNQKPGINLPQTGGDLSANLVLVALVSLAATGMALKKKKK